jgi:hypothetical protein
MKPPENENGGFSAAARVVAIPAKEPDALGELVNVARRRARFYFARHERTGDHADSVRAVLFQSVLVALLEARLP